MARVVEREEDVFRHRGADYMQRKTDAMKADYAGKPLDRKLIDSSKATSSLKSMDLGT